jgi:competence protein CoiA
MTKVIASDAEKNGVPYICPKCRTEVILHKGNIKSHHFKHKPPIICSRGAGETEAHYKAKTEIYNALKNIPTVTELELEKDFTISVADIYANISGIPVAIEIQKSSLSVNEIVDRTKNYNKLGIYVLWLGLFNEKLSSEKYSPKAWEKWCHAAYFGRVYYWIKGQEILPIHFDPYKKYIEEQTWFEPGGYEQSAGGYEKTMKRYKNPNSGIPALISRSFMANIKNSWSSGSIEIPECKIYLDIQPQWWARSNK